MLFSFIVTSTDLNYMQITVVFVLTKILLGSILIVSSTNFLVFGSFLLAAVFMFPGLVLYLSPYTMLQMFPQGFSTKMFSIRSILGNMVPFFFPNQEKNKSEQNHRTQFSPLKHWKTP